MRTGRKRASSLQCVFGDLQPVWAVPDDIIATPCSAPGGATNGGYTQGGAAGYEPAGGSASCESTDCLLSLWLLTLLALPLNACVCVLCRSEPRPLLTLEQVLLLYLSFRGNAIDIRRHILSCALSGGMEPNPSPLKRCVPV